MLSCIQTSQIWVDGLAVISLPVSFVLCRVLHCDEQHDAMVHVDTL